MTEPLLDVRDLQVELTAGRRVVHAVRGASFSVAPGEALGLVAEHADYHLLFWILLGGGVISLLGSWLFLTEPADRPGGRFDLPGAALLAVALLFLLLPLASVYAQALADGFGHYFASILDPDALAAVRLTLLVAVIAVPLNLVFGVAAASAFFGVGLGMSLNMAALARGKVGIVSTLSSMTPVVILPMVWIRTGVAPPRRAWAGALLAAVGTACIGL